MNDVNAVRTTVQPMQHVASASLAAGGALWLVASLIGGLDGTPVSQAIWPVAQLALLIGTLALWRLAPHGRRRLGTAGFAIATVARVAFVGVEVATLSGITGQDAVLPIAALLTAVGFLLAGVSVLREGRWAGWTKYAPLAVGVYPLLAMFPFAVISGGPPVAGVAGWGLLLIALGAAARSSKSTVSAVR